MLMARVAHDVGTPLNVIGSRLDRVLAGRATGDAALRDVRIANEQTERITAAIRSLLDFAHRADVAQSEVTTEELLRRARELLVTLARAGSVKFVTDASDTPGLTVRTVPQLALQALTNLCVNAIHASPSGTEVVLRVDLPPGVEPPASALAAAGPFVRFSVEDHGPGLPEGKQDLVFEPFFTTKPIGEGTGLGLPIARSIAQDLGGWLEAHPVTPHGTRFDLYLPVHGRSEPSPTRGAGGRGGAAGSVRCHLVRPSRNSRFDSDPRLFCRPAPGPPPLLSTPHITANSPGALRPPEAPTVPSSREGVPAPRSRSRRPGLQPVASPPPLVCRTSVGARELTPQRPLADGRPTLPVPSSTSGERPGAGRPCVAPARPPVLLRTPNLETRPPLWTSRSRAPERRDETHV
ncbi:MAG: hypothetical protein IPN77_26550 [Sandaracinaceae bacterium]|nr:hypothetical protein [Sandaracinaceae bacterium]